jgi:protein-tyrosine kinase
MSRFDKALERARATSAAESGSFEVMLPEEAPPDDVFDAPWRVTENPPEAAKRLAHVPTPRLPGGHGTTLRLHADLAEKVVADAAAPRMVVEQFRKLAGSLHQWQLEHGAKVVMVMSAVSAEGKTLTALNLALTLSGSYRRRVLLLDCDLRRPMMHEALQVAAEPGIAETAATGTPVAPIEVSPLLSFVPAGRRADDPVGALTSSGVIALIEQGRADYDWVVLDTPPAAVVPDASLLNDQADGVVLVVAAGRTGFDLVTRAVATVGRDRILGVVLNGVDKRDLTAANYRDYYSQR